MAISCIMLVTQMDLADAAGLSVVHLNCTVQELRAATPGIRNLCRAASFESAMSVETELKFQVSPRGLSAMTRDGGVGVRRAKWSKQDLVSTYFDTSKRKLKRNDLTLRVRQVDDKKFLQTVKSTASGNLARGEWEAEVDSLKPDIAKAKDTPLDDLNAKKLTRKLKPVFRTSVRRVTQTIRTRRSEIGLAVDRGKISANGRSQPIAEFELELKSGRPISGPSFLIRR